MQSGKWSAAATWGGTVPQDGDDAIISNSATVHLDINTAKLNNLSLLGTLYGGGDTIFVAGSFTGAGSFSPDSGTVAFVDTSLQTLSSQTVGNYYNLIFADSTRLYGSRVLERDLNIVHDFTCDLRSTIGGNISGQGSLVVGGNFIYIGDSTSWLGPVVLNRQAADTIVRLQVRPMNGVNFAAHFLFPKIIIRKADTTFSVKFGYPDSVGSLFGDTLYIGSKSGFADTLIDVESGTLDAGQGIISCKDSTRAAGLRPFIHLAAGSRFRTCRSFSDSRIVPYDTSIVPYFICDSGTTFEYYGPPLGRPALIDISYLANNLVGHSYDNIWISSSAVACFTYNPVIVRNNFLIWPGGATSAGRTFGPLTAQQITIRGDVLNMNQGQSGGNDDGMTPASDTWIFDSPNHTSHWSGPGAMSSIEVAPTTILSVRFISDTACDSLNFIDSIQEMGAPCGGRIIGRIFTTGTLNDSLQSNIFGNIGLTIVAGSMPLPGKTVIARTTGYMPPGIFAGSRASHAVLRYFHVTPTNGPQSGLPDRLTFGINCAESNGIDLTRAAFWRSAENGNDWSLVGRSGIDEVNNAIYLDTSCIGFPNSSNAFLWAVSDQEVDFPLDAGLEYFRAARIERQVTLQWKTYSEAKSLGFEIYRLDGNDTSIVGSWSQDPALVSQSSYGATYQWIDSSAPSNSLQYELCERAENGNLEILGNCQLDSLSHNTPSLRVDPNPSPSGREFRIVAGGMLGTAEAQIYDRIGREVADAIINFDGNGMAVSPIQTLRSGGYFLRVTQANRSLVGKFVVIDP